MAERRARTYTAEFKAQAVKLAQALGNKRACDELGIPVGTISGWVKGAQRGESDLGPGSKRRAAG